MSKLIRAIKECMRDLENGPSGELQARFTFPADFIGFKGHFPGKPVLPGVCKVQAVMCMLEASTGKRPKLKEICLVKFFAPATCDEELRFRILREPEGDEGYRVRAIVVRGEAKIADIQLRIGL